MRSRGSSRPSAPSAKSCARRATPALPRSHGSRTSARAIRARLRPLPNAKRSISRSSVRNCLSIVASPISSHRADCASSVRHAWRRSSSAAKSSRKPSWRATGFRRRAIVPATLPRRRWRSSRRASSGFLVVVKADGLAAGKGVVVAPDREEAELAVRAAMEERQFGDAGSRVVIEECLVGPKSRSSRCATGRAPRR